jgi:hypothetical protein
LTQEATAMTALRRKRRRHPTVLLTPGGPEEIIPGLSTWTAEDLVEAGAWDEELADIADISDEFGREEAAAYED